MVPPKTIWRELACLALYTILGMAATFPLVVHFTTAIPVGGDSWVNYWNLWWLRLALVERHTTPFFSPEVYFPYGASLYFHTLNLAQGLIALPLISLGGLAAAYNTLVFLSFALSGYGTFRLALYVLRDGTDAQGADHRDRTDRQAAFIGGLVFAFSSYRFLHLGGHLDLLSTQWIPFCILFLLQTRRETAVRYQFACGCFLAAAAYTSAYYLVFLLLFTGLIAVNTLLRTPKPWSAIRRIAQAVAIAMVLYAPLLIPMLVEGQTSGRSMNPTLNIDAYSTDLLAFVTPSPNPPLWHRTVQSIYRQLVRPHGNLEIVTFLGFAPLLLGLVGLARRWPTRGMWVVGFVLSALLALGPVIHVDGHAILAGLSPVMPYSIFAKLPYGNIPRVPARFAVLTTLCLAMLAASGTVVLLRRMRRGAVPVFMAAATLLIIGENAFFPLPMNAVAVPPFFDRLAKEDGRKAVLEVPIPFDPAVYPERMLYQTVHGKPIFGGYLARGFPPLPFDAIPGFGQFKTIDGQVDDVVSYDAAELPALSRTVLTAYSAGWIVIEKDLLDTAEVDRARHVADRTLGNDAKLFEDDRTLAYVVRPPATVPAAAVWLDRGWSFREPAGGIDPLVRPWHWMGDSARIGVFSSSTRRVRLKLEARPHLRPRRFRLLRERDEVDRFVVDGATHETAAFKIAPGVSFLTVESLDGSDQSGQDPRRFSAGLFSLELVPE